MTFKDHFSDNSINYLQYRPEYPAALFQYLTDFVENKSLAWDVGTGNGQAAVALSQYFNKVYATDASQSQLSKAIAQPNIEYAPEEATQTSLEADSVDLITAAQAAHWFDLTGFYAEVRRVAKSDAIIALWTYAFVEFSNDEIQSLLDDFLILIENYWPPERTLVNNKYATLHFPFEEIIPQPFDIEYHFSPERLVNYLSTWSGLKNYIAQTGHNPLPGLLPQLQSIWPTNDTIEYHWPIHIRMGKVS